MRTRFLTSLFILLFFQPLSAEYLKLTDEGASFELMGYIDILEDPDNELTFGQISSKEFSDQFVRHHENLNFGITSSTIWMRLTLANKSSLDQWLLELDNPNINQVFFYTPENGRYIPQKTGAEITFDKREGDYRNFIFRIMPDQHPTTYYVSLQSDFPLKIPAFIHQPEAYAEKENGTFILFLVYLAITLFIIVINVIYFFSLQDRIYLFYCGAAFAMIGGIAMISGFAFKYVWPGFPGFNLYASSLFVFVSVYFITGFVRKLLLANRFAPVWDKIAFYYQHLMIPLSFLAAFQLMNIKTLNFLSYFANHLSIIILVAIGIQALRHKYKPAITYFIGFMGLALGSTIFILDYENVIENPLGFFVICIGSVWEMVFFMAAMVTRQKVLQNEEMNKLKLDYDEKVEKMIENNGEGEEEYPPLPDHFQQLSPREKEVLQCIAKGMTDQEIADALSISKSTVKTHTRRIYGKLLVSNRTKAIAVANKYGLIS